jgi:hypothetical protein
MILYILLQFNYYLKLENKMNIFFLDKDPKLAAQFQCNKHVVKMILESAQLLSTVHHLKNIENINIIEKIYMPTHKKHPCTLWLLESKEHYLWLSKHAIYLCEEYEYRYEKIHKSKEIIILCNKNIPKNLENKIFSDPPKAMPEFLKNENEDSVTAYRRYYLEHKKHNIQCEWKKRNPPYWWK